MFWHNIRRFTKLVLYFLFLQKYCKYYGINVMLCYVADDRVWNKLLELWNLSSQSPVVAYMIVHLVSGKHFFRVF